jgi:hypothetical protein
MATRRITDIPGFPVPKPVGALARPGADIPVVLIAIEAIATVETTSQRS